MKKLFIITLLLGITHSFAGYKTGKVKWPPMKEGVRLTPDYPFLAEKDIKPDNACYYIRQLPELNKKIKEEDYETYYYDDQNKEEERLHKYGYEKGKFPFTELKFEKLLLENVFLMALAV